MILVDNYEAMTARPEIGCNLECVKDDLATDLVHEYCGPVKIVVVETPKQEYLFKAWGAAFLAYANMLIGAVCFVMLMREAARGKDNPEQITSMHMVLCTIGLLFLSSFGMMNMMPVYGPSSTMKKKNRQTEHLFFHSFGLIISLAGGIFYMSGGDQLNLQSPHTQTCLSGLGLGLITEVTGLIFARIPVQRIKKFTTSLHIVLGFGAYVMYMVCFFSCLEYDYLRKFLLRLAKVNGKPTLLAICVSLLVIIGIASLISMMFLFKRKRKPTCITFDQQKARERELRLKMEKKEEKE